MNTPRQTLSYLPRRFGDVGIHLNSRYGQNFLIDLNLVQLIADSAHLDARDVVLEVGTGTGSLTAMLARQAGEVVSVDIDEKMHQLASEELIDHANVTLLCQDALRNKNHFDDAVLDVVRAKLAAAPNRRFKLVANLPYNVATPVMSNLLSTDMPPYSMTCTIQKELADRIISPPASKDYSALSIWMQSQCEAEIIRTMPPTVFWPRPKVTSAIVHLKLQLERRALIGDLEFFHTTIRDLFCYRRKFLRSVLVSVFKDRLSKPQVDEVMAEMQFDQNTRAEALDVDTLIRLCQVLKARLAHVEQPL